MCICVYTYMLAPLNPEGCVRSPQAGITGGCELSNMDAGKWGAGRVEEEQVLLTTGLGRCVSW